MLSFLRAHGTLLLLYFAAVSLFSSVVTVYDKIAAKKMPHARVPEKTLLLLCAAGGALAMFFTMLVIRHKTRHPKFMFGIPCILLCHAGIFLALFFLWK